MGRYGSGMGLLAYASPTPGPCRGWGWTHPRPILTASMGQEWGDQPHLCGRSQRRYGTGPFPVDPKLVGYPDGILTIRVSYGCTRVGRGLDEFNLEPATSGSGPDGAQSGPKLDEHDGTGMSLLPSQTYTDQLITPNAHNFIIFGFLGLDQERCNR
jgi:hypothetical protein